MKTKTHELETETTKEILVGKDGMTEREASNLIYKAKRDLLNRLADGEPDYLYELLFYSNKEIAKAFGQKLRQIRLARELSQTQLAELCFLTQSAISICERGKGLPSFLLFVRLAQGLKVHPKELFPDIFDLIEKEKNE